MPVFHIDHKLADFDKWIAMFREGSARNQLGAKHGVTTRRVARDSDDPNHAIVVMEADTKSAVEQMFQEPMVQERFADTSVFAEPPSIISGYEGEDIDPMPEGEHAAFFIDHQLTNFDKWRETFKSNREARADLREKHGTTPVRLLHDIDDDNHAILIMVGPNRGAVEQLMAEPSLQELFSNSEIFKQPPEIIGQYSPVSL